MSAPSSTDASADQLATTIERGRRLLLLLTAGGYLLFLLSLRVLLPGVPLRPLSAEMLTGYVALLGSVLVSIPGINLRLLTLILLLLTVVLLFTQFRSALTTHEWPLAALSWLPLMIVLAYALLGWRLGGLVVALGVVGVGVAAALSRAGGELIFSLWLSSFFVLLVLGLMGLLVTRFIEERIETAYRDSERLQAARMDSLTGTLGRAAIQEALQDGLAYAEQGRGPLSLVVCDLDNFKTINDRHGHNIGDEVLRLAARRLRRNLGRNDQMGRWGGEEFLVVLPGVSKTDALAIAERLRREIAAAPLAGLNVTVSLGVSAWRLGDTVSTIFERADQAMYEAKAAGRNLVR
ncbi:GGDEF domain-containing protein [Deinococcus sonorensis]|uniref:GGDEF domain-containing protein n=2 Tax=Deinococcus sonorensis TaxID=309891 RepID=A0AAU7UBD6_9DEIO